MDISKQPTWLLIIVVAIFLYTVAYVLVLNNKDESKNETFEHIGDGAIVQLMAKEPQDVYLTSDTEKYLYYPNKYINDTTDDPIMSTPFLWNNGTRYPKWGWPYYGYLYNWYRDSYGYPGYLN